MTPRVKTIQEKPTLVPNLMVLVKKRKKAMVGLVQLLKNPIKHNF